MNMDKSELLRWLVNARRYKFGFLPRKCMQIHLIAKRYNWSDEQKDAIGNRHNWWEK